MGESVRLDNWPSLLAAFLADEKPFVWGRRDCCLFAADAVLCITGIDPAIDFRNRYTTAQGAARVLKKYGGLEGAAERITMDHGMMEIPVSMSQRGDVALIDSPLGDALAVVNLKGGVTAQGPDGPTHHNICVARRAWMVG
jgi:hypothetical protein